MSVPIFMEEAAVEQGMISIGMRKMLKVKRLAALRA